MMGGKNSAFLNIRHLTKESVPYVLLLVLSLFLCLNLFLHQVPTGDDVLAFLERFFVEKNYGPTLFRPTLYLGTLTSESFLNLLFIFPLSRIVDVFTLLKLLGFLASFFSAVFMYKFILDISKNRTVASIGSVFYLFGYVYIAEVGGLGHYDMAVSYAFQPLILLLYRRLLIRRNIFNASLLSFAIAFLISSGHLQVTIYSIVLFVFYHAFVMLSKMCPDPLRFHGYLFLSILIAVPLTAFFWIPLFSGAKPYFLEISYYAEETFWHSPNAVQLVAGSASYVAPLLVVVILTIVGFAVLFKENRRNPHTKFFLIAGVFFLLLSNGPSLFSWIYEPLFGTTALPGMLRVSSRIVLVADVPLSYLFGISVEKIGNMVGDVLGKSKALVAKLPKHFTHYNIVRIATYAGLVCLFIYSSYLTSTPAFLSHDIPQGYMQAFELIAQDSSIFRVAGAPFIRTWINPKPSWSYAVTIDPTAASSVFHGKDLFWGTSPHDMPPWFFNFALYMRSIIDMNRTQYFGKILALSNVKYLVMSPDGLDNRELAFFVSQQDLSLVQNVSGICVFKNLDEEERVFLPSRIALGVSGYKILTTLASIAPDYKLSNIAIIPIQSANEDLTKYLDIADTLVFQDGLYDYVFLGHKTYLLECEDYATNFLDAESKWSRLNLRSENVIRLPEWEWVASEFISSMSYAVTKSNTTMVIPVSVQKNSTYEVWLRVMEGPERGVLTFKMDNALISTVNASATYYKGFEWVNLGEVALDAKESHNICLENDGKGWNQIDCMTIIEKNQRQQLEIQSMNELENFKGDFCVLQEAEDLFNLDKSSPSYYEVANSIKSSNGYFVKPQYAYLHTVTSEIFVPRSGYYDLFIRAHVEGPEGSFTFSLANYTLSANGTDAGEFRWYGQRVKLSAGKNNVTFAGLETDIDLIVLEETNDTTVDNRSPDAFFRNDAPGAISYRIVDAATYNVNATLNRPAIIVQSNSFHELWQLTTDNNTVIEPIRIYSFLNGYLIEDQEVNAIIFFNGQKYLYIGIAISTVTVCVILAINFPQLLTYVKRKRLKNENR